MPRRTYTPVMRVSGVVALLRHASVLVTTSAVLFAFTFSGFLHNVIEHDHAPRDGHAHEHSYGPKHQNEEPVSAIWQSLHAAVRHEEKQTLVLLGEAIIASIVILILAGARVIRPLYLLEVATRPHFMVGRWLVTGIAPYRRFA